MLASWGTVWYNAEDKGGVFVRLNNSRKPGESKVMKMVNLAGTAVMLNFIFLLACVPVVTIGPAFCGLYSGVRYMIRGDGPVRGFWEGFKTRFVRMSVVGLILTAVLAYFVIILNSAYNTWLELGIFRDLVIHGICGLIPLMLLVSLVALNVYIPYDLTDWLTSGVNLMVKAPLWVLLSGILLIAPVLCLMLAGEIFLLLIVVFVGFWFSAAAFISTLLLKDPLLNMLLEYREAHPEEEEEL